MSDYSLTLFFSHKQSLQKWQALGILTRELALYQQLAAQGFNITFITYGRQMHERQLLQNGGNVLANYTPLGLPWYRRAIPLLFARHFSTTTIIKSNQLIGANIGLRVARLYKKPFVVRCGYLHSAFMARLHGDNSPATQRAEIQEKQVFQNADHIMVTTPRMRDTIIKRYGVIKPNISVIPNYVDTNRFHPVATVEKTNDVLFVGRLEKQKNMLTLLDAVETVRCTLTVVGSGSQDAMLKARAANNPRIRWEGVVPNDQLPHYLQQSRLFVLPSFFEGHPKALLEAMATGTTVIGSNVPGINSIIEHNRNGWLCEPTADALASALDTLLHDEALRHRLSDNALQTVNQHYNLQAIAHQEAHILRQIVEYFRYASG